MSLQDTVDDILHEAGTRLLSTAGHTGIPVKVMLQMEWADGRGHYFCRAFSDSVNPWDIPGFAQGLAASVELYEHHDET